MRKERKKDILVVIVLVVCSLPGWLHDRRQSIAV